MSESPRQPAQASSPLENLEVFCGELTPPLAQVFVRVPRAPDEQLEVAGRLYGPESLYGHTLPSSYPLVTLPTAKMMTARATIPDPCFWSPSWPALYELQVDLKQRGRTVEQVRRPFGLRFFGAFKKNLLWEGKRWVLRGVHQQDLQQPELGRWRELATTLVSDTADQQLCEQCSRQGVLMVVYLHQRQDLLDELRRLSRWPAVGMVVLPEDVSIDSAVRSAASNLVLAQYIAPDAAPKPAAGVQVLFCELGNSPGRFAQRVAEVPIAVVALRRLERNQGLDLAASRSACDNLQRDLAPYGQYAGYVV